MKFLVHPTNLILWLLLSSFSVGKYVTSKGKRLRLCDTPLYVSNAWISFTFSEAQFFDVSMSLRITALGKALPLWWLRLFRESRPFRIAHRRWQHPACILWLDTKGHRQMWRWRTSAQWTLLRRVPISSSAASPAQKVMHWLLTCDQRKFLNRASTAAARKVCFRRRGWGKSVYWEKLRESCFVRSLVNLSRGGTA